MNPPLTIGFYTFNCNAPRVILHQTELKLILDCMLSQSNHILIVVLENCIGLNLRIFVVHFYNRSFNILHLKVWLIGPTRYQMVDVLCVNLIWITIWFLCGTIWTIMILHELWVIGTASWVLICTMYLNWFQYRLLIPRITWLFIPTCLSGLILVHFVVNTERVIKWKTLIYGQMQSSSQMVSRPSLHYTTMHQMWPLHRPLDLN